MNEDVTQEPKQPATDTTQAPADSAQAPASSRHASADSTHAPKNREKSAERACRYRKGATLLIVVVAGLAAAILLFWATGDPEVEMWMFWTSTLVYLAASVLLTKAAAALRRARGVRSPWGYVLDAVYGAFFGISFIIATELPRITLFGGLNWYSALAWLWLVAFAVFFSAYLAQRHPNRSDETAPASKKIHA
ncbi:hypothetical protein ACRQEF_04135 [Actinotignum sp. GS-2025a]|uniref:hypothetical protein n=1 Tax=Actinotignum TaxID=1653174 RepID=UPI002551A407|nr:hypothetical protein [Actinotignum timonense]MDK6927472.1 hypothetical protein [Actinotignum timonense]